MIIGVSGYGFTGSGAVVDLLREYSEVQILDNVEFKLSYMPDGVETLKFHLVDHPCRYFSSDPAIRRFKEIVKEFSKDYQKKTDGKFLGIVDEYLDSLIDTTWKGTSSFHRVGIPRYKRYINQSILRRVRSFLYGKLNLWVPFYDKLMYLSIAPESFEEKSKTFLSSIIKAMGAEKEKIVLNQPFSADRPEFSFPYYEDPYAITVSRDPRDLYILAKEHVKPRARFIPTDSVDNFIIYYRKIMENARSSTAGTNRLLKLSFEDLIYQYEAVRTELESFLDLSTPDLKHRAFDPEVSKRNTQLFRHNTRYAEDVMKIEAALSEWLYPFEAYGHQEITDGTVF